MSKKPERQGESSQTEGSGFDDLSKVPFKGGESQSGSQQESENTSETREKVKKTPRWREFINRVLERHFGVKEALGSRNEREVAKLDPTVQEIMKLGAEYHEMSEEELKGKTEDFRKRIKAIEDGNDSETMDDIMIEAYAAMREATRRVLGMEHYESQLRGGVALNQGRIAEMQTGEGKTITAALPAYFNALSGKGVHVITSNDYLARRDMEQMSKVYEYMGLSTGLVAPGMNKRQRKEAYAADITYGTNSQFGFDYLRDNLAKRKEDQVQRGHAFALIDEVDSVLLDEARTPLVIAGVDRSPERKAAVEAENNMVEFVQFIVDQLDEPTVSNGDNENEDTSTWDTDIVLDKKRNISTLTEQGIKKLEANLGIKNLADIENANLMHIINNAVKARVSMKKDRDYIVQEVPQKDGTVKKEVVLVDKNTGRALPGRRFNDGLHQAIEAKEGIEIGQEADTQASITVRNYYMMYDKLSGMTGTGATESHEFADSYNLDVVAIPPERGKSRIDNPDLCFRTEADKRRAILAQIQECQAKGQPVLIGVSSVAYSRKLSKYLEKHGISHELLNATKSADEEARIIAQAGRKGAITIATNMAGRGTDISLGGNAEYMAQEAVRSQCRSSDELAAIVSNSELQDQRLIQLRAQYQAELARCKEARSAEKDEVKKAGGLFVLGAERNQSRRIDNQLRGRAGRQGDPGETRFFTSLEDNIMRVNAPSSSGDQLKAARADTSDHGPLPAFFTRIMDRAQGRSEGAHFDARKREIEYDAAMKDAREAVFEKRQDILTGKSEVIDKATNRAIESAIEQTVERLSIDEASDGHKPSEIFDEATRYLFGELPPARPSNLEQMSTEEFTDWLTQEADKRMRETETNALEATQNERETRRIILSALDNGWITYLNSMAFHRQGIGLVSFAERDPVQEYTMLGARVFEEMTNDINESAGVGILRARGAILAKRQRAAMKQGGGAPQAMPIAA